MDIVVLDEFGNLDCGGPDLNRVLWQCFSDEGYDVVLSHSASRGLSDGVGRLCLGSGRQPSEIWRDLILEGYGALVPKWMRSPTTCVPAVYKRVVCFRESSNVRYDMIQQNRWSPHLGEGVCALVRNLTVDHGDLGAEPLSEFAAEWGFHFGDICCLFAAVGLGNTPYSVRYQDELESAEQFIRCRVWLCDLLCSKHEEPPRTIEQQIKGY